MMNQDQCEVSTLHPSFDMRPLWRSIRSSIRRLSKHTYLRLLPVPDYGKFISGVPDAGPTEHTQAAATVRDAT